jgi:hypothetical protein
MRYEKTTVILPEKLVSEIQKYVQREIIYIPKLETTDHYLISAAIDSIGLYSIVSAGTFI